MSKEKITNKIEKYLECMKYNYINPEYLIKKSDLNHGLSYSEILGHSKLKYTLQKNSRVEDIIKKGGICTLPYFTVIAITNPKYNPKCC